MKNIIQIIKETVVENVGSDFLNFVETALDFAPYIGQLNQTRKINRLERRFKEFSNEFKIIQKLYFNSTLSSEFITDKIGPIVLSDIIEEHEDSKIIYLLYGFQNVFIEERNDESLIYKYYDTFRELRYGDLRRLYFHAGIDEVYPSLENLKNDEYITYAKSVDIKLNNMHLINKGFKYGELSGMEFFDEEERFELSSFGKAFLNFFRKPDVQ